jgi:TonB family protein
MRNLLRATVLAAVAMSATPAVAQENSLAAAKELYVAAEYTSALKMLTALAGADTSKADLQAVDLYRSLCLLALGNTAEANKVIESMLMLDPLYRPEMAELPPRMRSAFTDARKRLLPGLVQQRYVVARAAFEAKNYEAAATGFQVVLSGLADPDLGPASAQPPLSDLKVLAAGFQELATKAAAPVETAAAEAPLPLAPPPTVVQTGPRIYGADDLNVVPPQTVRQVVPSFPGRVLTSGLATIDIFINEQGGVDSVVVITSLNPQYDRMAVNAARNWQYKPALLNGTPVKYRKRLQLTVVPEANRLGGR